MIKRFDSRSLAAPLSALLLVVLSPSLAHAHVGVGPTSGIWSGLAHPVTGLDHICAMVAVGLWAAQRGGRALWLVPLAFGTREE
jgi:urease accessory protein